MSDFLTELRREVIDAHAAHARRPGWRRFLRAVRDGLRLPRLVAVAWVACLLVLVVTLGRLYEAPEQTSPHVVATLDVGGLPAGIAYAGGSIWVADASAKQLVRIDPDQRRVRDRIDLPGQPYAVAAGPGGELWIRSAGPSGDATVLTHVDPLTGDVIRRVPAGPDAPLAVTGDAAWVAVWATDDNVPREGLYRVDSSTSASRRIGVPSVGSLAAGSRTVWALRTNGELVSLDSLSGRVRHRFPRLITAAGTAAGAHALAGDDATAWALATTPSGNGELVRVEGDAVASRRPLPSFTQPVLAVGRDALWTVATDRSGDRYTLNRLDPGTARPTSAVVIGTRPIALSVVGDEVWALGADGAVVVVQA